ncbi:MAG: AAA family ATPase [Planctomycetota bacterium]
MGKAREELTADQVRGTCNEAALPWKSTADLDDLDTIVGQARAVEAIEFGMDIEGSGFNIYVLGPAGTGKTTTVRRFVEERAKHKAVPDDWCYVHNFEESHKPQAIRLPAGNGREFRDDMKKLASDLRRDIQRALENEDYTNERAEILKGLQAKQSERVEELEKKASEAGFQLQRGPQGVFIQPVKGGEALSPQEFEELPDEEKQGYEQAAEGIQGEIHKTLREIRDLERDAREKLQEHERKTVLFAVKHHIDNLQRKYAELDAIVEYLDQVRDDVAENAPQVIRAQRQVSASSDGGGGGGDGSGGGGGGDPNPLAALMSRPWAFMERYTVNLIVDNSVSDGAPVVMAPNPIHPNLIGRVERQAQFGMLMTNFTMIQPGALHRANGGYLILEAEQLLRSPFAYDALKRSLKNEQIRITDLSEMFSLVSTVSLEPEPIPLDVKVIITGHPLLYYLLHHYDEAFPELFKVKADFNVRMDRDRASEELYARFLASRCSCEGWPAFDATGIARMIEYGSELVGDQTKLSTRFAHVCDMAREAAYWAGRNGGESISRADVQQAIEAKIRRSNRVEELIQEMIERGDIFIDAEGAVAGQVNGLSVIALGDYTFGKPSRITARTHMGKGNVVNIEREVKLSGPIHDKGVLILAGYLNGVFGHRRPLSLAASIGFEQSYEGVEGDSASSTELYALLSSLADIPIRQGLAVTGSVNQRGEIQPIGGATEKVEGFFDVCKAKGLTGDQGVLIPRANVKNLMLRPEVVDAVRDGQFHLYPVESIAQGIEILTGVPAGERQDDGTFPEGTVFAAVEAQLDEYAERWKEVARQLGAGPGESIS